MWTKFSRFLVNRIFLVGRRINKFKEQYPDDQVIVAGGSKAIVSEKEEVFRGKQWIFAKRAVLILSNKRLVCGSWEVNLNDIDKASIISLRSFLAKGLVLKIRTKDDKNYQFGLQYDPLWIEQEVLDLEFSKDKIKFSLFSIIARLILIFYIIDLIIDIF